MSVDLIVTVGLLEAVMATYPEEVKENFAEKVQELIDKMTVEINEFQQFGEAFDG